MELLMATQSNTAEEELFAAALALPEPERCKYLERACAGDAALSDRLRALLEASEAATEFMSEPGTVARDGIDAIGPYRLVKELGEGGCGVAYLAEQTAPVKREVALKVIKPGMDTRAVIARFEAERQVLALMDHPHVAKVFDAGATSAGRPYFVMELVRGIKITDYCNQSRLNVRERLILFIQVCHAIQHAHLKGIIHRDIKPSNVLVTMHDGASIAKVIDFGIAKAMQGRLTDDTVHTALGQFIGTPAYVSPEQTDLASADVDTRSDIYSLGVLLYELLTGCTPFDVTGLTRSGPEQEPVVPSKRANALRPGQEIQVDLDWIVIRCLEKERERRYQTVHDLILDVKRYLNHEPVLARPPSIAYTLRKFARRHRTVGGASLAAGIAVASMIALLTLSGRISSERIHAQQQGERADRISSVMLDVLEATNPYEGSGIVLTPGTVLGAAERSARTELQHQPHAQVALLDAIGIAYRKRGELQKGVTVLEDALRLRKQLSDDVATLGTANELIATLRNLGELRRAEEVLQEGFTLAKHHRLEGSAQYARLLRERGRTELVLGNISAAQLYLNDALILMRRLFGERHSAVADVKNNLSATFMWTDDLQAAERLARDAIAIYEAVLPAGSLDTALAQRNLGDVYFAQNRWDEAATQFSEALRIFARVLGENTTTVANILDSLAQVRQAQGRLAEAEELARRAVATYALVDGKYVDSGYNRVVLGAILTRRSKFDEAELELRRALDIFSLELPADHQYIASAEFRLGEVLLAVGRLNEAEATLAASMERWNRARAPAWRAARSANALGEVLHRQGRLAEARRFLVESARELEADPNAELWAKRKAQERTEMYLETPKSRVAQTVAQDN
jgi:eukaryotic-like serine/threonine-protein kinase